jgi:cation diffusion facilitator family transporter
VGLTQGIFYEIMQHLMEIEKKKRNVALLSVASNSLLVVMKLIIGLAIGSVSVISEAIHSGVDLLASIIAFFAVKTAGKPADDQHTFGHGKFENLSGTIEALLIFVAAGWIINEAIEKLIHPQHMNEVGWGILIMAISSVINLFVSRRLFKIGKESDSLALLADGWHLRTDVYTSAGVALGLILYYISKFLFPQYNFFWIDPVVAILVALLILKAAYQLTVQSAGGLLDEKLPKEEEKQILSIVHSKEPRILSYHNFKTRKAGSERFIEFHLIVDQDMSVKAAHDICDEITAEIKAILQKSVVMIHTEPCLHACKKKCLSNCNANHE